MKRPPLPTILCWLASLAFLIDWFTNTEDKAGELARFIVVFATLVGMGAIFTLTLRAIDAKKG